MILLLTAALLAPVRAADPAADYGVCPTDDTLLSGNSWLRALSLDLRGVVPSPEEYAALDASGEVDDALIDSWLGSDAFAWQAVRFHRSLLWPNVTDIRLIGSRQRLLYEDGLYYRYQVAQNYRGCLKSCGDFEASWTADGEIVTTVDEEGCTQEGWVEVNPYWDAESTIKVCAFEAQETFVSPLGTACDTFDGRYDPYCGCGPNLAWCDTFNLGHNGDNPNPPVAVGIAGDLEHRVAKVVGEDQSYLELLTGRTMFVNGPLVHFLRYQTRVPAHVRFNEVPVDPDILPDLAFEDEDTWVEIELGEEQSGILTSMLYLMKFQTRRARANRFYNAFLCQPFQPPDGGLEDLDNPDATLNLQQRDGCQYCHALLEPAAAHWGRWGEYGVGYLDPVTFPAENDDCTWCAATGESCSTACRQYYVIDALASEEDPYIGWLDAYEFLEERNIEHVEVGPQLLVYSSVVDGRLPMCVASNTAEWLLGREIEDGDEPWITDLAREFSASSFSYQHLVREIVTSEEYRRVK
jgi:hypothetical protein